jgi:hypothetical protein
MTEKCTLALNREDVLQILDALTERLNVWRNTAAYLRDESTATGLSDLVDCGNAIEAELVVQHYMDVIASVPSHLIIYNNTDS